jgi:hypothetical protein
MLTQGGVAHREFISYTTPCTKQYENNRAETITESAPLYGYESTRVREPGDA